MDGVALRDNLRDELKRQVRKWLDERGVKADERSEWWKAFRKIAREKHGIEL